jgi:outer membrane cobalamin receptor
VTDLDRGLPGPSYAPSDSARQALRRVQASGVWDRPLGSGSVALSGYVTDQRVRFTDPTPPLGQPFDDLTTLTGSGVAVRLASLTPTARVRVGAGARLDRLSIESGSLSDGATRGRTDAGAYGHAAFDLGASVQLGMTGRLDRAGSDGAWYGSHDVTLTAGGAGGLQGSLSHRSAFSPPSMGDQFFQEGVGVRANPDLRAERTPSEVEATVSYSGSGWSLAAAAYRGNVRDLIVWLPDFRYVWSPTNTDVRLSGLNVSASGTLPGTGLSVDAAYDLARVTYDREARDDVQVAYRPRHSARLGARWLHEAWSVSLGSRYVGRRYPVPNPVNALPGFWTTELGVRHDWTAGVWRIRAILNVDRLLDGTDTLIYAFPDPGRTVRAGMELRRLSEIPPLDTGGRR